MPQITDEFWELLEFNDFKVPAFTKEMAVKLLRRIDNIQLYAHSYSFYLNFNYGDFDVIDLLDFAFSHELAGIDIDIREGNEKGLLNKSREELENIKNYAQELNLKINLEISSTTKSEVDSVVKIAKILGIQNIRVYIRYGGLMSSVIKRGIKDLRYIAQIAEKNDLHFFLESHEVLKSHEMVHIINEVDHDRVSLLFDFGNMISANEKPMEALKVMSPYIKQAHIKGVRINKKGTGFETIGVRQGEGDLPQNEMLLHLLLLGDHEEHQVKFFGLQQEVGYYSPPYRFDDEDHDPVTPNREPSRTPLDGSEILKNQLITEKRNAYNQVHYVRKILTQLRTIAEIVKNKK